MPKHLKPKRKIPTLLGIVLLIISLVLGVGVYLFRDTQLEKRRNFLIPKNIELINISESTATITWQTDSEALGEVILVDPDNSELTFKDDRDIKEKKPRTTHFVTLTNLRPQTQYIYRIKNESEIFSNPETQKFSTSQNLEESETALKPLSGAVVDGTLQPVEGALVFLQIAGAAKHGTYTNKQGNFILPVKNLLNEALTNYFKFGDETNASLLITHANLSSTVEFTYPPKNSSFETLPLGRNVNLREYLGLKNEEEINIPVEQVTKVVNYDLNGDGKINSVDLSVILQYFGKRINIDKVDFNSDGVVDEKDIELFTKAIPN